MAVCIHAVGLGLGDLHNPGVGFLFFWSGVVLGILSLILLGMAFRRRKEVIETSAPPWGNVNWFKKIAVLLALVGYGLLFEWLGFLVSTVLFVGFLLRSIEPKRWVIVVLVSLLTSSLAYLLFETLLQSRLPKGIMGF